MLSIVLKPMRLLVLKSTTQTDQLVDLIKHRPTVQNDNLHVDLRQTMFHAISVYISKIVHGVKANVTAEN